VEFLGAIRSTMERQLPAWHRVNSLWLALFDFTNRWRHGIEVDGLAHGLTDLIASRLTSSRQNP